jgi:hypothetical protein
MPCIEASVSTSKTLSKSGTCSIGAVVRAVLRALKLASLASVHWSVCCFRQSVRGAAMELKFFTNRL